MRKRGCSRPVLGRGIRMGLHTFLVVRRGKDLGPWGRLFGLSAPMLLLDVREMVREGSGRKTSWARNGVRREEEGVDRIK